MIRMCIVWRNGITQSMKGRRKRCRCWSCLLHESWYRIDYSYVLLIPFYSFHHVVCILISHLQRSHPPSCIFITVLSSSFFLPHTFTFDHSFHISLQLTHNHLHSHRGIDWNEKKRKWRDDLKRDSAPGENWSIDFTRLYHLLSPSLLSLSISPFANLYVIRFSLSISGLFVKSSDEVM